MQILQPFLSFFPIICLTSIILLSWLQIILEVQKSHRNEQPSVGVVQQGQYLAPNYINKAKTLAVQVLALNLSVILLIQSYLTKHFPLSNLYESLIFLAWSICILQLILERKIQFNKAKIIYDGTVLSANQKRVPSTKDGFTLAATNNGQVILDAPSTVDKIDPKDHLSLILSPILAFIYYFGTQTLPLEMQKPMPLVPALQSNWLVMHVSVMIIAYTMLIIGSLFSVLFLIFDRNQNPGLIKKLLPLGLISTINTIPSKQNKAFQQVNSMINPNPGLTKQSQEGSVVNQVDFIGASASIDANFFDDLSYRLLGIGFPFLTLGIISGAIWANEAWGSYWSWDPKETWALITWFIFAIYLHVRLNLKWKGKKPASVAVLGFFIVWICFLGVNLLGKGLHTYGNF